MTDSEIIFSVNESIEGGYEAQALGHDIFTQGETMEELCEMVRDAVRCHFGEGKALPVVRLVQEPPKRVLGSAKGEFTVPDDFNDPLPKDIEDLFWK